MPDVLIRDVPTNILNALKKKAADNRRSLQQELMVIIESAAKADYIQSVEYANLIRERLQAYGAEYTDSTELIKEDRMR